MINFTDRIAVTKDGRIWRTPFTVQRSDGRIMSFSEKECKLQTDKGGYAIFMSAGVNYKVHRVVAETFIPNPENLPEVNHKNGDKKDNRVENLEWISHRDNIKHSFEILKRRRMKKLSDKEVLEIFKLRNEEGLMLKDIARMYGIAFQTVHRIAKGDYFITKEEYNGGKET